MAAAYEWTTVVDCTSLHLHYKGCCLYENAVRTVRCIYLNCLIDVNLVMGRLSSIQVQTHSLRDHVITP